MTVHTVLDLSGQALEDILITLAGGGAPAAALGKALDALPVAAYALGLGTAGGGARDTSVALSFLLAFTCSSRFIASAHPAQQHPINLARNLSTLNALHGPRIGLALHADAPTAGWFRPEDAASPASAADYLRLVSSLWDSWPMDALIGDTDGGRYVDADRIVRIADPVYTHIGGPLTLPTDIPGKPPLLLLSPHGAEACTDPSVDLQLNETAPGSGHYASNHVSLRTGAPSLDAVLAWPLEAHARAQRASIREALQLPAGRSAAVVQTPVFKDAAVAVRV